MITHHIRTSSLNHIPVSDSNHFVSISKSALSRLQNEAKLQKMHGMKYVGSPLGDQFIGIAIIYVHKLSFECAEKLIPLYLVVFLCDCGSKEIKIKTLGSVTPSINKIKQSKAKMINETVDRILTGTYR